MTESPELWTFAVASLVTVGLGSLSTPVLSTPGDLTAESS
jgi:hypothetical protein